MSEINKEELLKKAQELLESENVNAAYYEIKKMANHFRSHDDDSYFDEELNNKFNECYSVIASKAGDIATSALERKEEIIKKAKEVLESGKNMKNDSTKMKQLFDDWKQAGRIDKEKEDELWNEFNEVRNNFYAKRQEYYDQLKVKLEENKQKKEALIEKCKDTLENVDVPAANKVMNDLMAEWKKVGFASKEFEEDLWKEFSGLRKQFFEKRDHYYDAMKQEYKKRAAEKEEIIAQAKLLLARSEFSDEEIKAMDELKNNWKKIGSSGREFENDLWEKFTSILNKYKENMKFYK